LKSKNKYILLSFDVEEFDTPLEYSKELSIKEQLVLSNEGLQKIVQLLDKYNIPATFFTTANFAIHFPEEIRKLSSTREIASHGYYHSKFEEQDLYNSKKVLEEITGKNILGYRMARMMPVNEKAIKNAGYKYNASLNPTFIPGRYNNFNKPRTCFFNEEVLQIPASVTPLIRVPLFWLTFKNFPLTIFKIATKWTINNDGYVSLYFHPWEFVNSLDKKKFGLPFYISSNGKSMEEKMSQYIRWGLLNGYTFISYHDFFKMIVKITSFKIQ